jgi:hypothetical protein
LRHLKKKKENTNNRLFTEKSEFARGRIIHPKTPVEHS